MAELLLLGCSSRKAKTEDPLPALYRYDGPFYQDLRSHLRGRIWPKQLDVAVLSAEFGFIGALTQIGDYDRRMTPERATELAPLLEEQTETWTNTYDRVSVCLGKDYRAALPDTALKRWKRARFFEGPIGIKRQQLAGYMRGFELGLRFQPPAGPRKRLSYFLPDWDDVLDPDFDFEKDEFSGAKEERGEKHCALLMRPYKIADGILVSLAQAWSAKGPLRYLGGLDPRSLRPIDLRTHYGLGPTQAIFGDCGAFSYVNEEAPPISVDYAISLYDLYNFDFAASVDHIPVPEIVVGGKKRALSTSKRQERVALTIENAELFLSECKRRQVGFQPVGTVQALSPTDFARNACAYAEMGYSRIALGGLVPLPDDAVKEIVERTMTALSQLKRRPDVHLFGIFRPRLQARFQQLGIRSFDSATYFRKAWLRAHQNYLAVDGTWYSAVRVPMTRDGRTRNQLLASGSDLTALEKLEVRALSALHEYGRGQLSLRTTLSAVMEYDQKLTRSSEDTTAHRVRYERTLTDRPWEHCKCPICTSAGIDVAIFRGSNRNKRRGAHNTWRLYSMIKDGTLLPNVEAD